MYSKLTLARRELVNAALALGALAIYDLITLAESLFRGEFSPASFPGTGLPDSVVAVIIAVVLLPEVILILAEIFTAVTALPRLARHPGVRSFRWTIVPVMVVRSLVAVPVIIGFFRGDAVALGDSFVGILILLVRIGILILMLSLCRKVEKAP